MSSPRDRSRVRAPAALVLVLSLATLVPALGGCGADTGSGSPAGDAARGPFRDLAYTAALEAARAEQKLVLIDFFTTWCPPCKKLDKETWPDPRVAKWLSERTVALKVDAEEDADLARLYRVEAYPTIVIAKADGTEIDRLIGFLGPEEFVTEVEARIERAARFEQLRKPPRR